jgi:hypothetical protein
VKNPSGRGIFCNRELGSFLVCVCVCVVVVDWVVVGKWEIYLLCNFELEGQKQPAAVVVIIIIIAGVWAPPPWSQCFWDDRSCKSLMALGFFVDSLFLGLPWSQNCCCCFWGATYVLNVRKFVRFWIRDWHFSSLFFSTAGRQAGRMASSDPIWSFPVVQEQHIF